VNYGAIENSILKERKSVSMEFKKPRQTTKSKFDCLELDDLGEEVVFQQDA